VRGAAKSFGAARDLQCAGRLCMILAPHFLIAAWTRLPRSNWDHNAHFVIEAGIKSRKSAAGYGGAFIACFGVRSAPKSPQCFSTSSGCCPPFQFSSKASNHVLMIRSRTTQAVNCL